MTASAAHLMPNFDHWAVIASNPTLARFMMGRPLPTQGMQMIAVAAILGFKRIHISGIDLYADMSQRYAWDVPDTVRQHLQEKDVAAGYEKKHSLDLDLHFLRAIRDQYEFELVGLSRMEIMAPFLNRTEVRSAEAKTIQAGNKGNVYVTMADGRYAIGAMALARSLATVSDVPLLVMHTDPYTPRLLRHLPNVSTLKVDPIDNPHNHGQSRFAGTFTKLRVFELLDYDRITFVDADCVMLKNIDDLFGLDGFLAAPDWGSELHIAFNSGVFSFTPSESLRNRVFSAIPHSHSSDGGDQGFLNVVFAADVKWLPVEYNTLKRLPVHHPNLVNISDVKVLHFVGENPWDTFQSKPEFTHLEAIWSSFMEKEDWRHAFWMNKSFISKRWGKNGKPAKTAEEKKISFEKRLNGYGPIRRTVVRWGDILLPDAVSKPLDRTLKRIGIL
ncbi:alpha-2,3-sialyltransferase [Sinorhizobium fredii]|uniref:alpha-2,3-sialyltransferase n=1 Tax=Rhizobium fredii TaxID=380 RepID=UPI001F1B5D2B|nr:alpha-2,3-sialyltransferase [Sinorhizobium fredii]